MMTSTELDNLERLSATIGYLPHRKVQLLIASYREVLQSTPHLDAPQDDLIDDFVRPPGRRNRRKKNETTIQPLENKE